MGGGLSRKAVFLGSFNQIWNSLKFICSWEVINKLKSSKHKPERQYAFTSTALFIHDNEKKKTFLSQLHIRSNANKNDCSLFISCLSHFNFIKIVTACLILNGNVSGQRNSKWDIFS
jgi:hypothetical protein